MTEENNIKLNQIITMHLTMMYIDPSCFYPSPLCCFTLFPCALCLQKLDLPLLMIYVTILDINECASNGGRGPCDDTCENKDGGYECGCSFPGSKLSKDNHTCLGK